MVEINNQRKAFLDMFMAWRRGRRELITDVKQSHGYDVIVGRRAIYWCSITLANLSR